jgi:protein-L-isoaspartate(D-aspartate) O-methyltransferase
MDLEVARFNMIEQQIRPWGVVDPRVLEILRMVRREEFVSIEQRTLAFADLSLPIGHNEVMWQPKIEARILQALAPLNTDRVLEVGTGSGYFTALLASCASHVTSIDIQKDFIGRARNRLKYNGINNIDVGVGDGALGWPSGKLWDVIVLTGSVPALPNAYRAILAPNGRLIAVVGQKPMMEATLYVHQIDGAWATKSLFDTVIPPLVNVEQPSAFSF